jgi:diacylglycerol kinase family enzyme
LKLALRDNIIAEAVGQKVKIIFVDLLHSEDFSEILRQIQDRPNIVFKSIIAIICGGDGTFNWVINELTKWKIDISKMVFAMLPIGTGNDFCRSLGQQQS